MESETPLGCRAMNAIPRLDSRATEILPMVRYISSPWWTFWQKWVTPTISLGFTAAFTAFSAVQFVQKGSYDLLLISLGIAVWCLFLASIFSFPFADEVRIEGEDLVVRKVGREDRIPFRRIVRVAEFWVNPESISVTLDAPCRFGTVIFFVAAEQRWSWQKCRLHPLSVELAHRADSARNEAAP
jgi:hypothetical protein